ncbi:MAG: hypothetical protein A2V99_15135 [Spirochaetes bacterium RBG_16_67_19]|nr:MAG: hypothetical protein A2V99_15135 [Spirochaetes bacterium RBG_16_67_19]
MKHVIDTNCLLSFVTDRNLKQNRRMAAVFERASILEEEVVLVSNVISEFVYVQLSVYKQKEKLVSAMIADLVNHPGVQYHHGFFPETILSLWPGFVPDFGDAVIATAAKTLGIPVYTFDLAFRRCLERIAIPVDAPE